jgi:hypothetical protein
MIRWMVMSNDSNTVTFISKGAELSEIERKEGGDAGA